MSTKALEKALQWALTGDTGMSSLQLIATHFGFGETVRHYAPRDEGDRSRCVRALEAVPEAVETLRKLAERHEDWAAQAPLIMAELELQPEFKVSNPTLWEGSGEFHITLDVAKDTSQETLKRLQRPFRIKYGLKSYITFSCEEGYVLRAQFPTLPDDKDETLFKQMEEVQALFNNPTLKLKVVRTTHKEYSL